MLHSVLLSLASFVALSFAQSLSLSTACTTSLTFVAANPDAAACLSPGSLLPLVAGGNSSVITPINTWLTSVCGSPACSNATISAVVQNVTQGCATELSALGFQSSLTSSIITIAEQYYPAVRQILCLKDGNTNCITELLTDIQNAVGTLSLANLVQNVISGNPSNVPSNITCTDCVKAAYNIVTQDIPSLVSNAAPSLQSQCGASFTDGTKPSNIVESASTSSATTPAKTGSKSSALSYGALSGLGASAVVLMSTFFTLLA